MSAIVERLRNTPNWQRQDFKTWKDGCSVYDRAPFEAADEIERLERELAEAESALWRVAPNTYTLAPGIPDPFEGSGETYAATYDRLRRELAETEQKRIDEWLVSEALRRELAEARAEVSSLTLAFGALGLENTELQRELDEARGLLREARFCADYMASGMTHAPWMTEEARKRLVRIDAFLAAAKEGER